MKLFSSFSHAILALVLISSITTIKASPNSDEVKKVQDYYLQKSGNPILVEYKFCMNIVKEGENKRNCEVELDKNNLPQSQPFYLWMNFLVTSEQKTNLLIQENYKGITRHTHNLSMNRSIRYRSYKKISLSKLGQWKFPILVENADDLETLAEIEGTVTASTN